jgi:hypothetical protein
MNTETQIDALAQYEDAEGVARASADYDADHAFNAVWQDGDCEVAPIARAALGDSFVEPTDSDEVNKIAAQLRHMAEMARVDARTECDDAQALVLFRRADELGEAADALHISDDSRTFFSQVVGDELVEDVLALVEAWDESTGGFSWIDEECGEGTSARDAWDRELNGSRSGFSSVEVVATRDRIDISFSGYCCDMSDISLVTRRGDVVEAVTSYLTDVDLGTVDGLASLGMCVLLALGLTDVLPNDIDAAELTEIAQILDTVKDVRRVPGQSFYGRVREAVEVLGRNWSGNSVELVRAAVVLSA